MAGKTVLLLAFLALAEAASISYPSRSNLDVNFNQFGFKLGAKFQDKSKPMEGGKVYMEIPANLVMRILRGEPSLVRQLLVPFKEEMYVVYEPSIIEKLYDVVKVKLEMDYDLKSVKSGVMSSSAKYVITHHDYSEESGRIQIQSDGRDASLKVSPSEEVLTKTICRPLEVNISKKQKEMKMTLRQEETKLEASCSQKGQVFEAHMKKNDRYQMTLRMDVGQQKLEFLRSEDNVVKTKLVMDLSGDKRTGSVRLSGKVEATRYWKEGTPVEIVFKKNEQSIDGSCTFNNFKFCKFDMDLTNGYIKFKANIYMKGLVVIDLDSTTGHYLVTLPKEWFHDYKSFTVEVQTSGQDCEITLKREKMVFYTVTMTNIINIKMSDIKKSSLKTSIIMESKNTKLVDSMFEIVGVDKYKFCKTLVSGCFTKGKYSLEAKSGLFSFNVEKEDAMVMEIELKGTKSHMEMNFFYPKFFMKTLNKPFETLTVTMEKTSDSITVKTNFENMKMVLKKESKTVQMTIFKHNEIYVDMELEYTLGHETTIESHLTLNEKSFVHQKLCDFSTHLCFQNIHYHLKMTPKTAKIEHTITKDDKNVLTLLTNFSQKPYTFKFESSYILPFYRYIQTQKSLISRYLNPLPMMLTPIKIEMEMDRDLTLSWNIDMKEGSIVIKPTHSNKYELVYKSGEVTKQLEFTMTENMLEYGQVKVWKDTEGKHFQYTTKEGVKQMVHIKTDKKSVTLSVDVKHGETHVSQELTTFLPYKTGKDYNFYFSWSGEGELPYVQQYTNQGTLGLVSVHGNKVLELVTGLNHHKLIFTVMHTTGLHFDFDLDYNYII